MKNISKQLEELLLELNSPKDVKELTNKEQESSQLTEEDEDLMNEIGKMIKRRTV